MYTDPSGYNYLRDGGNVRLETEDFDWSWGEKNWSTWIGGPGEGRNGTGLNGVYYDWYSGCYRSTSTLEEVGGPVLYSNDFWSTLYGADAQTAFSGLISYMPGEYTVTLRDATPQYSYTFTGGLTPLLHVSGMDWLAPQGSVPLSPEVANAGKHDAMDYINAFVGAVGTYFGLTGNLFHNELYWVQKNGTLRSTQIISNANKIYRTSYNVVKESLTAAKTWSNRLATLGIVVTGIDIAVDGKIRPSHAANIIAAGISFTGVGSIVAGAYWVTDIGFDIFTGFSLGVRLDQWLDPQHGGGGSW